MFLPPTEFAKFQTTLGNKLWRLNNLYKIRDKKKRLIKLTFNPIQQTIWRELVANGFIDRTGNILKPIRDFILKYRQGGVSTFWLLFWLDDTMFHENTVTGIQTYKKENLGYLFKIVRIAYQNLSSEIRPELDEDTKSGLSFKGMNSQLFISLAIRSTAIHNLHISEWALCEDTEIMTSLGAVSPEGNITGETTGNGVGNHAYELYHETKLGESEYKGHFFPWFIQPEYRLPLNGIDPKTLIKTKDEECLDQIMRRDHGLFLEPEQLLFRRAKQKELKGIFRQEFPETDDDAFLTSGHKFFEPRKIHRLLLEAKDYTRQNPPIQDPHEDWIIWEAPAHKHIYAAGADTAEGGGDYSYLKVLCVTCRREAFRYRARCGVDVFYRTLDKWGRDYKNSLLAVERNNHGHAVLLGLEEICHYPNLYREEIQTRAVIGQDKKQAKLGWITDKISKPLMLDDLKYAIEGNSDEDENHFAPEFTVLDQVLLSECLTFEEINGKYEAIEGKHDDGVIASAIAFQMYKRLRRYVRFPEEGTHPGIYLGDPREIT